MCYFNYINMKMRLFIVMISMIVTLLFYSCQNIIEVEPENVLDPKNYYRDKFDADAAVFGIYGQLFSVAEQYVILNELRGDLMDVTPNSDKYLVELNNHTASENNPYVNPKNFYKVILNCNDVLKNFDIMLQENKLDAEEYAQRYSDVLTLRSWLYHQLSIHYNQVPYITESFMTVDDVKDLSRFPWLSLPEMTATLIETMENLPYKNEYPATSSLYTVIDNYNTRNAFINKKFFLGDLHLWQGNYTQAATYYKDVMMTPVAGVDYFDSYRVKYADVANNNDIAIGYIRNREQDIFSLIDTPTQGWKSLFVRDQDPLFLSEWIWVLPYRNNYAPENPFFDLFAINGGSYRVKPSQEAMDLWNDQTQRNGFGFDQRGRFTYSFENGQPVIKKYIFNYTPPLEKNGKWFLNRAALLHLRFAEAANRDNKMKLAYALLNIGISPTFDPTPGVANRDLTHLQRTKYAPPYDFDARSGQVPFFRDTWHRNNGVRGRASLTPRVITDPADSVGILESQLIEEAALELAYEGHRWPDLLRVAMRRNDPSFLASKVYNKLLKSGRVGEAEQAKARLEAGDWFLPFKWE